MIELTTEKSVRQARNLDFCYLCGGDFSDDDGLENCPDHVPPKTVFAAESRDYPLKVACHRRCNAERSQADEQIGQLFTHVHERTPRNIKDIRLKLSTGIPSDSQDQIGLITGTDVHAEVWRWVRAFHASLYREFLPATTRKQLDLPLAQFTEEQGELVQAPISQLYLQRSYALSAHLNVDRVDEIRANDGALRYMCFWTQQSERCDCIFALQLSGFKSLGDIGQGERACIGQYSTVRDAPPNGSAGEIRFPIRNSSADPYDPFAE